MNLTPPERTLLINRHRILKILDPAEKYYHELKIEMFKNGYEGEGELYELEDPLTKEDRKEVYDTLDMFRSLQVSADNLGVLEEFQKERRFLLAGYDGNNETVFSSITEFVIEKLGKYASLAIKISSYCNSHSPMQSTCQSMLAKWRDEAGSTDSGDLSETQINKISRG
ncbi:MAG: YfbU family protein [Gammaproteobacteria bacterium]|nr:YfbU family protein [Gammaproteobacteria bacterium]